MNEKELFIAALNTLFFSWGGDTPAEATWAGNDLLDWYEKEYNVNLGIRFIEYPEDDNFGNVIVAIRSN